VKKRPAAYLQRNRVLLELARGKSEQIRIRWRSKDLGAWASVNPRWQESSGRIRFQFRADGRLLDYWLLSASQKSWGICLSLRDSITPLTEMVELAWQPLPEAEESRPIWKTAKNWLSVTFPGCRILRATKRPDLVQTLSGSFLRVLFHYRGKTLFLIAADAEAGDEADQTVGQALLWIRTLPGMQKSGTVPFLHILVPSGASAISFHRCRFLNKHRIGAEVWEYDSGWTVQKIRKAPQPPVPKEDKDFRWPVLGPFRWSPQLERVLELAPELIRRYPRFHDYDSLRLWGLEFAQVLGLERDRILFGVGSQRTELTDQNFDALRSLVQEIQYFRRADSPDPRHPFYRLQAERWLEALILEDIPHLFPEMAPESVYSQIPVYLDRDSGRIDILGADRLGTLIVLELKVVADPDMPIQALDYWGRVIEHNANGDFEHRGYFSEVRLNRQPPKIYLVSPVFSFHDTTETLLRYLEPDLEVWKIAINEDWRCGVRILRRRLYLCKEIN
jgi:hypothetical protein